MPYETRQNAILKHCVTFSMHLPAHYKKNWSKLLYLLRHSTFFLLNFLHRLYLNPTPCWYIKKRSGTRKLTRSITLCFFFIHSLHHTINSSKYASITCNTRFILLVLRARANNWRKLNDSQYKSYIAFRGMR